MHTWRGQTGRKGLLSFFFFFFFGTTELLCSIWPGTDLESHSDIHNNLPPSHTRYAVQCIVTFWSLPFSCDLPVILHESYSEYKNISTPCVTISFSQLVNSSLTLARVKNALEQASYHSWRHMFANNSNRRIFPTHPAESFNLSLCKTCLLLWSCTWTCTSASNIQEGFVIIYHFKPLINVNGIF